MRSTCAAVLAVRRRVNDGVDLGIGENLVEIVAIADAVLGAKRRGRGAGAAVAGGKAKFRALAVDRADQSAAPAAEPDDRGADHFFAASKSRTPRNAK